MKKSAFLLLLFLIPVLAQQQKSIDVKFDCLISSIRFENKNVFVIDNAKGAIIFSKDTLCIKVYERPKHDMLIISSRKTNKFSNKLFKNTETFMKLLPDNYIEVAPCDSMNYRIKSDKYAEILKNFEEWRKKYVISEKK